MGSRGDVMRSGIARLCSGLQIWIVLLSGAVRRAQAILSAESKHPYLHSAPSTGTTLKLSPSSEDCGVRVERFSLRVPILLVAFREPGLCGRRHRIPSRAGALPRNGR